MVLDLFASDIDWGNIAVPEKELPRSSWQAPYMEQYLNENGTERICELFDEPTEKVKPCRVVFFLYKPAPFLCNVPAYTLQTPYGNFLLKNTTPVPERLKAIVEFEEVD